MNAWVLFIHSQPKYMTSTKNWATDSLDVIHTFHRQFLKQNSGFIKWTSKQKKVKNKRSLRNCRGLDGFWNVKYCVNLYLSQENIDAQFHFGFKCMHEIIRMQYKEAYVRIEMAYAIYNITKRIGTVIVPLSRQHDFLRMKRRIRMPKKTCAFIISDFIDMTVGLTLMNCYICKFIKR